MNRKGIIWGLVFVVIFLLHQDYFFFSWPDNIGFLGLPSWLAYFIGLHILFLLAMLLFSRNYWKD